MAAPTNSFIRVRLLFDYPPPAVVDCRMCWLLVDLNTCRVVADLESVIREKFDFGRGSILSLFVEGCYLPHTESVYVVRDNDSVRVKVDSLAHVNEHSSCPDVSCDNIKKRQRDVEEDGLGENGVIKKKRKKRSVETAVRDSVQASGDEWNKELLGMKKKKKKKKQKQAEEKGPPVVSKPAASPPKKTPVKVSKTPPVAKSKPQKASSSDASSSSSSSEEDKVPKKPAPQKATPKAPTSATAASRAPPTTKLTQTKSRPPLSSSSETSDDESAVKSTPKLPSSATKGGANSKSQQASPAQHSATGAQRHSGSVAAPPGDDSDSEEEIKLVIRQPAQQPVLGLGARQSPWRGRGQGGRGEGQSGRGGRGEGRGGRGEGRGGRGEGRGGRGEGRGGRGEGRGGRGEEVGRGGGRGAGRGRGASFGFRYEGAEEPSCRTDQLTNLSTVLQNGAESAPKKDYSCLPLLAAPPQVGQKIAFKLLELTENYTPEVSHYKEGKIVSFDLTTKQIELQLLNSFQAPVEPGKFDLVYQNADGSESVEYAVVRGSRVTERWDSLLEPRLII